MSEKLCELRKHGGGSGELSETVLWTNPSPTSSMSPSSALTLSDNISNYKYLKIYWRMTVNNDIQSNIMVSVEEFKKMDNASNSNFAGMYSKGTNSFARGIYHVNDTTFGTSNCYQAGTTTMNNGYCIITKVSGLK